MGVGGMFLSKVGKDPRRPSRPKEGLVRKSAEPRVEGNSRSEAAALLTAARAVLENRAFADAARAVLGKCKSILGAEAGFVALRAAGGDGFEVALLDPGSVELDSAGGLPAPLRRLSVRASRGRAVFANELSRRAAKQPSSGHPPVPQSALLAPIVIAGVVAGLVGLINKPGGFSIADRRLAEVVCRDGRRGDGQQPHRQRARDRGAPEHQRDRLQAEQTVPDAGRESARRHRALRPAAAPSLRQPRGPAGDRPPAQDFVGKTNRRDGDAGRAESRSGRRPCEGSSRAAVPRGSSSPFRRRTGCGTSTAGWFPSPARGAPYLSVLTVARDVTDRWLAHEAERRARTVADALREATVALTRSLDRETVLATLLDRLRRMVPFDRASVMLVEEASRVSVRAVFDGDRVVPLPPEERPEFDPTDHPIVHGILTTGTAVLIPDVRAPPRLEPADGSLVRGELDGGAAVRARRRGRVVLAVQARGRLLQRGAREAGRGDVVAGLGRRRERGSLRADAGLDGADAVALAPPRRSAGERAAQHRPRASRRGGSGPGLAALSDSACWSGRSTRAAASPSGWRSSCRGPMPSSTACTVWPRTCARRASTTSGSRRRCASTRGRRRPSSASTVRFKARGFTSERLPPAVETALYRVVQEAMTNVVRHAQRDPGRRAGGASRRPRHRDGRGRRRRLRAGPGRARGSLRPARPAGARRGPGRDADRWRARPERGPRSWWRCRVPIRILIADDHAVVRSGLRALLRADPDLEVVGEAEDGVETLRLAEALHPDLVLLDITMPPENGIKTAQTAEGEAPARHRAVPHHARGREPAARGACAAAPPAT